MFAEEFLGAHVHQLAGPGLRNSYPFTGSQQVVPVSNPVEGSKQLSDDRSRINTCKVLGFKADQL